MKQTLISQEFGPRALQGFQSSELTRGRRRDYRPREPSPVRSRPRKRPRFDRPKTPPKPKMAGQSKKLPYFRWPCKLILKDMKDIILASGVEPTKEIIILQKMIRITLRKRLAVLCEGKPIMLASELAALYREEYPVTADETFVAKQLNDLRGSHMSMGDDGEMGKDTEKDKKKKSGKKPNEELVEKKNGEEVKEGQKAIKTEGIEDSKVEQDKPEKSHEVHDVTGILTGQLIWLVCYQPFIILLQTTEQFAKDQFDAFKLVTNCIKKFVVVICLQWININLGDAIIERNIRNR